MRLPSKELLSVVTGIPISKSVDELGITRVVNVTSDYDGTYLNFKYQDQESSHLRYFNLYELVHKCKEWALAKNLFLSSGVSRCSPADSPTRIDIWYCSIEYKIYACPAGKRSLHTWCKHSEIANTEPETVFKACEWILKAY